MSSRSSDWVWCPGAVVRGDEWGEQNTNECLSCQHVATPPPPNVPLTDSPGYTMFACFATSWNPSEKCKMHNSFSCTVVGGGGCGQFPMWSVWLYDAL